MTLSVAICSIFHKQWNNHEANVPILHNIIFAGDDIKLALCNTVKEVFTGYSGEFHLAGIVADSAISAMVDATYVILEESANAITLSQVSTKQTGWITTAITNEVTPIAKFYALSVDSEKLKPITEKSAQLEIENAALAQWKRDTTIMQDVMRKRIARSESSAQSLRQQLTVAENTSEIMKTSLKLAMEKIAELETRLSGAAVATTPKITSGNNSPTASTRVLNRTVSKLNSLERQQLKPAQGDILSELTKFDKSTLRSSCGQFL